MKNKNQSNIAQHLADSLLDDAESVEESFRETPPSKSVSIAGWVPPPETPRSVENTAAIFQNESESATEDDRTVAVKNPKEPSAQLSTFPGAHSHSNKQGEVDVNEETVVAAAAQRPTAPEPTTKVRFGGARTTRPTSSEAKVYASPDASLVQAESLKVAQERILQLESEVEKLRGDNEELASAGETLKDRADELMSRLESLDRNKRAQKEDLENEIVVLKGRISHKDSELNKLKLKNAELETRLQRDFKKVRVRERELENRLELARMENTALIRSKDETILDLKRRIDQLESEADAYRHKCQELNHQIDSNQEQFRRTVKALRLALTNLEVDDEGLAPFKKAE